MHYTQLANQQQATACCRLMLARDPKESDQLDFPQRVAAELQAAEQACRMVGIDPASVQKDGTIAAPRRLTVAQARAEFEALAAKHPPPYSGGFDPDEHMSTAGLRKFASKHPDDYVAQEVAISEAYRRGRQDQRDSGSKRRMMNRMWGKNGAGGVPMRDKDSEGTPWITK